MIVPNTNCVVLKLDSDKKDNIPEGVFEATVYSVGGTPFSPNPVYNNGQQFTFARMPEEFPLKTGDRVVVGSYSHLLNHNDETYVICYKSDIYAVINNNQNEITVSNQETQNLITTKNQKQ